MSGLVFEDIFLTLKSVLCHLFCVALEISAAKSSAKKLLSIFPTQSKARAGRAKKFRCRNVIRKPPQTVILAVQGSSDFNILS